MAQRATILSLLDIVPPYLYTARLVTLSKLKGKSCVNRVNDIRPIGILSNITTWIEKAIKIVADEDCPRVLNTECYQQGASAEGTCVNNFAIMQTAIHKIRSAKRKKAILAFFDMAKAYDSVIHDIMISCITDRLYDDKRCPPELRPFREFFTNFMLNHHSNYTTKIGSAMFKNTQAVV